MIFTEEIQEDVIETTRERFALIFPAMVEKACCLHWAWLLSREIQQRLTEKELSASVLIQAGTALWPTVRPDQDNGIDDTHWGFQWNGPGAEEINKIAEASGLLREIHIWVAIIPRYPSDFEPELIDITTGSWPATYKRLRGDELCWPGDAPPDYFWTNQDQLPDSIIYSAEPEAIEYALKSLISLRETGELP